MPSSLETLVGSMTIAELAQRSGKSVEAIASFALGGAASSRSSWTRASSKQATGRRASTTKRPGVDDPSSFDQRVLAAIEAAGGDARSVDIEGKVGGTPAERRAALQRLVEARKLKRSGVARATRYALR